MEFSQLLDSGQGDENFDAIYLLLVLQEPFTDVAEDTAGPQ